MAQTIFENLRYMKRNLPLAKRFSKLCKHGEITFQNTFIVVTKKCFHI